MDGAAVANFLRGLMEKSAAAKDKRWQERYDDIDRIVGSAEAKFAPEPKVDLSQLWAKLKAQAPTGQPRTPKTRSTKHSAA